MMSSPGSHRFVLAPCRRLLSKQRQYSTGRRLLVPTPASAFRRTGNPNGLLLDQSKNMMVRGFASNLTTTTANHPKTTTTTTTRSKSSVALVDDDHYDESFDETTTTLLQNHPSQGHAAAVTTTAKSHAEAWMINLARNDHDNAWLTGPRPDAWWTGVHPRDCAGVDDAGANAIVRSLPLPNLSAVTRQAAKEYFDNSWTLYETLFAGLKGEEGFYR